MTGVDFIVPAQSWDSIEANASKLRSSLGLSDRAYLPVIEVMELVLDQQLGLVSFQVGERGEMDGAEGLTCPDGGFIMLRQDVYEGACEGQGRPRFTAAHELGHWALHTNIRMQRSLRGDGTPPYRLAEPQANHFASAILMPRVFVDLSRDSEDDLISRFGVSREAAGNRLRYLRKKAAF